MDVERTSTTSPLPPAQEPLLPETAALRVEEQRRARGAPAPDFFFLDGTQKRSFGDRDRGSRGGVGMTISSSSSCSRVLGSCFLCGSYHPEQVCPLRMPATAPPGFRPGDGNEHKQ